MNNNLHCLACNKEVVPGKLHGWGYCAFQHVMVDIETLGASIDAAVVQIAAVRFDPIRRLTTTPEGAFNYHVQLSGDPTVEGKIEMDTLLWWMSQPEETLRRVFHPAEGRKGGIVDALISFATWLRTMPFDCVWANGPQFDLAILKHRWTVNKLGEWPIPYREERDYRTLREVGRMLKVERPVRVGRKHDALDDAFNQAGYAIEVLGRLGLDGERPAE